MELLPPQATWALPMALLLLTLLWAHRRGRAQRRMKETGRDQLDTVAAWPPQAVRVLTINERQAYELLRRAVPGFLVLAQVPLSRFLRVPTRNSYTEWIQRVGLISADLLLCDAGSRVLAVIDVRAVNETPRAQRRHERMVKVLRAADVRVITWHEGQLPSLAEARAALLPLVGAGALSKSDATTSRPVPLDASLEPASSLAGLLRAGDRAAMEADDANEPVPSAFFEDCEVVVPSTR